jgi:hypothetical protein
MTEDNAKMLKQQGYDYICVNRTILYEKICVTRNMNILNPSDWNTEFYDSKITSWVKSLI